MAREGRWDFLEGVKAMGAAEAIAGELSKLLAEELARWPLDMEWADAAQAARFAPLEAPGAPRPSNEALRQGFMLARLELLREEDALDYALRNHTLERALPDAADRLAAELVWRWMTETLYELSERTEGRVKRRHLVSCLEQTWRRVLNEPPPAS